MWCDVKMKFCSHPSKIGCNWLMRWVTCLLKTLWYSLEVGWNDREVNQLHRCFPCMIVRLLLPWKHLLTESNVRDLVLSSLLVNCLNVLLVVLTKVIDTSLMSGHSPDGWKCARVDSLLKSLDKNYWLSSNVQYFSKIVERALFEQTHGHMVQHHIYPVLQSSYRAGHSTETASLKGCEWHRVLNEFRMCHVFLHS